MWKTSPPLIRENGGKSYKSAVYAVFRQFVFNNAMRKGGVKLGKRFFDGYL